MTSSILIDSVGPSEVSIDVLTQEITVTAYQRGVTLAVPGPQGPQGIPGPTVLDPIIKDPVVGRLSISGVEMGDTGWRDVRSLAYSVDPSVTIVRLDMRRHGYQVDYLVAWNQTETTDILAFRFDPPPGFRYAAGMLDRIFPLFGNGAAVAGRIVTAAGGTSLLCYANSTAIRAGFSHPIRRSASQDAWPTSLPGTPA